MTIYNIGKSCLELQAKNTKIELLEQENAKASQEVRAKDIKIQSFYKEITKLSQDKEDLQINSSHDVENALQSQKDNLNEKHKIILQNYSERIKVKYKETFDKAAIFYESEIRSLKCLQEKIDFLSTENEHLKKKVSLLQHENFLITENSRLKDQLSVSRSLKDVQREPVDLSLKGETLPSLVPYLDTLQKLRQAGGLKPD